jgi:hypothetical protein
LNYQIFANEYKKPHHPGAFLNSVFSKKKYKMTSLISQVIKRHTLSGDISTLCNRFSSLQLNLPAVASFHTAAHWKNEPFNSKSLSNSHLLPVEVLRQEALKVSNKGSLRSRCPWTEEEDEKLMRLIETKGKAWTAISYEFVNRSPSVVMNRYALLTDEYARGAWQKDELEALKKAGQGRIFLDILDWHEIQRQLPRPRPLFMIRQTYKHTVDPRIKHGRWTKEESDKLRHFMALYGDQGMERVAEFMGSRTPRQCLERWRWQMADVKKGRFSAEEDALITAAVKKYGENFAVICKVTGIQRTPRHLSQHYHTFLAPNLDKSQWTREEEEQLYKVCMENNRNMTKTKEILKSNRAIRDMWNHFNKIHKIKTISTTIKKE